MGRQLWLQGLQGVRGTETDRQTGMVARVAKAAGYKDRQTGMVAKVPRHLCKGSKGCKVQ